MSGFRKGRSTIDNIINLENDIQKNINNKKHVLAVFLDLEKAYDRIKIKNLIKKLKQYGIQGKMLSFIHNYLTNRTYQVRVGKKLSGTFHSTGGLPQGSILSPLLFNIMLSDIPTCPSVSTSLYADDCAIWTSGSNVKLLINKMQKHLNSLESWLKDWGFKLSENKTVPVLFTKSKKKYDINLKINEKITPFQNSYRFLGMIFDQNLNWNLHINNIIERCKRKINLLKCLAGSHWGNSSKSLLIFYRAYIRPLLDYGCEAYDSATDSKKKSLNSIQYQALRICANALPLTSLTSLQVEMGEPPLDIRRKILTCNYRQKIESNTKHPIHAHIQPCWQFEYMKEKKCSKPFGLRSQELDYIKCEPTSPPPIPMWTLSLPKISTELSLQFNKGDNPNLLKQTSLELICTKWKSKLHIFTDGSKDPRTGSCGASFWIPSFRVKQAKRLTNHTSSYRAELAAILLALYWIEDADLHSGAVIFSDSLSALTAMAQQNFKENLIIEILIKITHLYYKSINIFFEWIPSHCGIMGNETADLSAKQALSQPIEINNKLNYSEIKPQIQNYFMDQWQKRWLPNESFLFLFKPKVRSFHDLSNLGRREETIIRRLRLGTTGLNGELLRLGSHPTGKCEFCPVLETVTHLLLECPKFIIERAMLLAETHKKHEFEILDLLTSLKVSDQKAIIRYIIRTKRFCNLY